MFWPTALKNKKIPSLRLRKRPTLALSSAILFLLQSARFICAPMCRQEDKIIFFGYIKYSIPREPCPGFRCCHLWRSRALCHPGSTANQSTCDATHLSKYSTDTVQSPESGVCGLPLYFCVWFLVPASVPFSLVH